MSFHCFRNDVGVSDAKEFVFVEGEGGEVVDFEVLFEGEVVVRDVEEDEGGGEHPGDGVGGEGGEVDVKFLGGGVGRDELEFGCGGGGGGFEEGGLGAVVLVVDGDHELLLLKVVLGGELFGGEGGDFDVVLVAAEVQGHRQVVGYEDLRVDLAHVHSFVL